MLKPILRVLFAITSLILFFLLSIATVYAKNSDSLILDEASRRKDLYPAIDIIKDRTSELSIDQVVSENMSKTFIPINDIGQKKGFFKTANWLRFTVDNQSNKNEWLLEFAFPLIYEIQIFVENDGLVEELNRTGATFPFEHREIEHRNFVFNLEIEPGETKTYYVFALGGGDLHPPIIIWDKDAFIEKTVQEFVLLGIFYGVILVMIFYNLFLYFSLRLKSYLYYVMVITASLLGKISINGIGFQFIWPNAPAWNKVSTSFWVALACIFILLFTRSFLDVDEYFPIYKQFTYVFIPLNAIVILMLPVSLYIALNLMSIAAFSTFIFVLTTALVCLIRGVRQARFYLAGWVIFLVGVSITILERAAVLPFTIITEYAGQGALTMEVVLLSLALADKINIMRREKALAEKNAAKIQEQAIKNLKKADQLKDDFLAITSHELRTPLYGMIGIAESLRDGISGQVTDNMKKQLQMIITSGRRLTHLVDDILDLSKLRYDSIKLQRKAVQINSVMDLVLAVIKPLLAQKPIRIIHHVNKDLPPVLADERRLQQILYNLIDNAIKYTDKGDITISTSIDGNYLTMDVTDTGQGMSKEQLEIIFQPFQQGSASLSRETSGLGIGLNITKKLVELHEGKLDVISEVGKGSTFRLTLPLHEDVGNKMRLTVLSDQVHENESELLQLPPNMEKNKQKILVADDEVVNLQVLMNQLSLEGYDVWTAQHGEEVFSILEKHNMDLLILDIMMPGISGYDICQKLRKKYSLMELPILMLTAKNQLQDKMIAFDAGANDYLVKPCDKQELMSRVKTLVRIKTLNQELTEINLHLEDKVKSRTEELKNAHDHLQQMTTSRRKLLANIAHELGTPITIIHNYVQSVQKGLISGDDKYYQKLVNDKIKLLNRLIEDLFDLSILESGKISFNIKEFSVQDWLEQVNHKNEWMVLQSNRQYVKGHIPPELKAYSCFLDKERMDQLFSNLVSNAIKYTAEHTGKISLKINLLDSTRLLIQIIDNGSGIKEENLPYIFERFYKSSEKNRVGTGLGLVIVKQIIEKHKGEIWVESKELEGTIFSIVLPIREKKVNHK